MKRECYIVRDLLPLYLEEIVSDETAAFVRTHLEACEECAAELEAMRSDEGLCRESVETQEHRMQEAAVLSRIERSLRKDKWISIAATAFCVIVVGVLGFIFWTDIEDRMAGNGTMAENGRVVDALSWIRVSNRSAASSKEDPGSSFCYFPAEVEGTSGTMDKFAELVEEGEEIISDNPEEILGIKIDSKEELYTFVEKMQYGEMREGDILLITGVGEVYPYMRTHKILDNLQHIFAKIPVLVLYPGVFTGQRLDLFGKFIDGNYYRAFNLI
jgi:hypothetical protein